jgi:hypothetical protein
MVESANRVNYSFDGAIKNHKCVVPIKKVRGLLDENEKGTIYLEVIVEDTLFRPWKSDYTVEEHTSIRAIPLNEGKISYKPSVLVKVPQEKSSLWIPKLELSTIFELFGITKNNFTSRKSDIIYIISEYFKSNKEFLSYQKSVIKSVPSLLK